METEELKETAEDLTSHISDYAETFFRLSTIKVTQKASNIASVAISSIIVGVLIFFVLLFGGLALGWWLGDLLNSRVEGFLIVAGFYLLLTICLVLMRKSLVIPYIRNIFIRKIYE